MPYIDGQPIPAVNNEQYYINLIPPKRDGQCVAMSPTTKAQITERGGVHGGLEITVSANSSHQAFEMAKLIAECIWAEAKAKEGE